MNIKVLNFDGKPKVQTLELSNNLIGVKVNNRLLKYVIDWQLNRSKKRIAKTKQRNEITGSTRKSMLKKELVEPDIQVERHQYLLAVVLRMDQKEIIIKLKV